MESLYLNNSIDEKKFWQIDNLQWLTLHIVLDSARIYYMALKQLLNMGVQLISHNIDLSCI